MNEIIYSILIIFIYLQIVEGNSTVMENSDITQTSNSGMINSEDEQVSFNF